MANTMTWWWKWLPCAWWIDLRDLLVDLKGTWGFNLSDGFNQPQKHRIWTRAEMLLVCHRTVFLGTMIEPSTRGISWDSQVIAHSGNFHRGLKRCTCCPHVPKKRSTDIPMPQWMGGYPPPNSVSSRLSQLHKSTGRLWPFDTPNIDEWIWFHESLDVLFDTRRLDSFQVSRPCWPVVTPFKRKLDG